MFQYTPDQLVKIQKYYNDLYPDKKVNFFKKQKQKQEQERELGVFPDSVIDISDHEIYDGQRLMCKRTNS